MAFQNLRHIDHLFKSLTKLMYKKKQKHSIQLACCEENPPMTPNSPHKGSVMRKYYFGMPSWYIVWILVSLKPWNMADIFLSAPKHNENTRIICLITVITVMLKLLSHDAMIIQRTGSLFLERSVLSENLHSERWRFSGFIYFFQGYFTGSDAIIHCMMAPLTMKQSWRMQVTIAVTS